jgi:Na+-transporting methylmalonyl-CoA/oxaloacetate decarboxylase gamma subunit
MNNLAGDALFVLTVLSLIVIAVIAMKKFISCFIDETDESTKDDDDNSHLNIPPSTE